MRPAYILLLLAALLLAAVRPQDIGESTHKTEETAELPPEMPTVENQQPTLYLLAQQLHLDTLVRALQTAEPGVLQLLQGNQPYTLFAPSEEAFRSLDRRILNALLGDPIRLRQVLLYHLVSGVVSTKYLRDGMRLTTLSGEQLLVRNDGNQIHVNDALLTSVDHNARNGLIHIIDRVLIPPSIASALANLPVPSGSESTIMIPALLRELHLNEMYRFLSAEPDLLNTLSGMGPYTLFAPSEEAWSRLSLATRNAILADPLRLRQLLLLHVVPGLHSAATLTNGATLTSLGGSQLRISTSPMGDKKVNEALIISADHYADNGVIHIIDSLLIPPRGSGLGTLSLISLARQLGLTSFLSALPTADMGLYQTLDSGHGPYTVFIPSNEALASVGSDVLSDPLLLRRIILNHIVFGNYPASSLSDGLQLTSLAGAPLDIAIRGGAVSVNAAHVTSADNYASNGIIHIIDSILIPVERAEAIEATPLLSLTELAEQLGKNRFLQALRGADALLYDVLHLTRGPYTLFVPTDEAFDALGEDTWNALLADPLRLRQIILYHIVSGLYTWDELTNGLVLPTLVGDLTITRSESATLVNGITIVSANNVASNGVIYNIDRVLLPSSLGQKNEAEALLPIPQKLSIIPGIGNFLTALLVADSGLAELLRGSSPYTVFAIADRSTTDSNEQRLALTEDPERLRSVLRYLIVIGSFPIASLRDGDILTSITGETLRVSIDESHQVRINDVPIISSDNIASNGVIHVLDRPILPPSLPTTVPSNNNQIMGLTLLELAERLNLRTFLSIINSDPSLAPLLSSSTTEYTLWAPNDAAFANLGYDLRSDPTRLRQIVLYWIAQGAWPTSRLRSGQRIMTLEGEDLVFSVSDSTMFLNDARVLSSDNRVSNGVLYIVDKVLIPPSLLVSHSSDIMAFPSTPISEPTKHTEITYDLANLLETLGLHGYRALVDAAGELDVLARPGPYTVFAPTDEALSALPEAVREGIVRDPSTLRQIIDYSILDGRYPAASLTDGLRLNSLLQGSPLQFTRTGSDVFVNEAKILTADQMASNGILHIIDRLLIPTPISEELLGDN